LGCLITSSNGTLWTDISGQSYTNFTNPESTEQMFTLGVAVNPHYIRVYVTKIGKDSYNNNCMQLAEIQVE